MATATGDHIFLESFQNYNYIAFRGLDKNQGCRFHVFGNHNTDVGSLTAGMCIVNNNKVMLR